MNNNLIHVSLCNKRQQISKNKCENEEDLEDLEDVSPSQTVQSRPQHVAWNNIFIKLSKSQLKEDSVSPPPRPSSLRNTLPTNIKLQYCHSQTHLYPLPPPKLSSLRRMLPRIIFDRMCCYPVYAVTSTKTINSPQDVAWNEVPLNPAAQGKAVSGLILDCPGL